MTNRINLDSYLSKYGQQSHQQINMNESKNRSRRLNDHSYQQSAYNPQPRNERNEFQSQPTLYSGFSKAQNECIDQLQEIKRGLISEERQLSFFLQNYSKKLYDNLLIEHNRIREQILDMFDRVFTESQRRISDIVSRENGTQPLEFMNIRKRIAQINENIDKLNAQLRGENYRNAIAKVVTSDFESQMRNIQGMIANAQKNVLENAIKLVIDQSAFNRLKDDIQNLIITDGKRNNLSNSRALNQTNPPNQLNDRKPSRSRLGLFQTAPQPKDNAHNSGGFFNFGS